jgi:hypothetical protein
MTPRLVPAVLVRAACVVHVVRAPEAWREPLDPA